MLAFVRILIVTEICDLSPTESKKLKQLVNFHFDFDITRNFK